ncbi:MAG TPA: beta-eliminating lyase-related protein [Rectinemataceae bacterium]|nr:beta-eliminating lyase-related protein [Rectinemataceae bacterium]
MNKGNEGAGRWFASDNNASIHPAILKAIERANRGHAIGYGEDPITERTMGLFKETFGRDSETYLVWNGTGANVMGISAALRPWEGIVCVEHAHISGDEAGAPERIAGVKLFTVHADDAKLTPESISQRVADLGWVHSNLPRMVSISQPTEFGTVYSLDELAALGALCREKGYLLHVDGARLSNAAVSLGASLKEAAGPADLLSFGGTKNGLMCGEALVFLNPSLSKGAGNLRKSVLQLASKMRFISAQYEAYLGEGLWKENATKSNRLAKRLEAAVRGLGIVPALPVQANGVFAAIPRKLREALLEKWFFYPFDESRNIVRWMCSWDNEDADIDTFAGDLARLSGLR